MIGASVHPGISEMTPPSVDITQPEGPVEVEIDRARGVLYVHVEGFTCLRICRCSAIHVVEEETNA